jgi:hypothetical protein
METYATRLVPRGASAMPSLGVSFDPVLDHETLWAITR